MTAQKLRLHISDDEVCRKINFMAATTGSDPKDIVTEAVNRLWEERGSSVLEAVKQISPVSKFLGNGDTDGLAPATEDDESAEGE